MFECKFLITPTQGNDTGSDNGRQPTAQHHRTDKRAFTPTATGFNVHIQNLVSPFRKRPIKYICGNISNLTAPQKRHIFLSSCFLQDVTPTGQSSPCHKGRGCCNRRMPWFTSKCSPSWDRISLHPLILSPAIIRVERLSCSHVKITELRWMVWYG